MDDTSFDLLCKGMTPDEARLFRKILKEWCDGDENAFPVQLALLTRAQWLAAAQMPLVLQKIVAAFENRLADQQKQIASTVRNLSTLGDEKSRAFEETVAVHTGTMEKVAAKGNGHLDEMEKYAREIRKQMEYGLRETDRITKAFIDERHALEGARQRYESSLNWRETGLQVLALMLAVGMGFILCWYYFCRPH